MYVLVDCNNFFVSCERVFRPDLNGHPTVVLSNNDGCIVARSNEVKALGVPMGVPLFEVRELLEKHHTTIFSANFSLYGDMSWRVTEILRRYCPSMEIYSVDESFLDISTMDIPDLEAWGIQIREDILRSTGLPVSVGIAPTKTLAKLGSDRAKKDADLPGVGIVLRRGRTSTQYPSWEEMLRRTKLDDIWGVGRRTAVKLYDRGMKTAWDLVQCSDQWILQNLHITGLRTVQELRGTVCYGLNEVHEDQKSMVSSRSFGHTVRAYHELEQSIATHAARVAAKLRQNNQVATEIAAYIRTGSHVDPEYRYSKVTYETLPVPSNDTSVLITAALRGLEKSYNPDVGYKKSGVWAAGLLPVGAQPVSLLEPISDEMFQRRHKVMSALDQINHRYGPKTLLHAAEGVRSRETWAAKRERVSPINPRSWGGLPIVKV